MKTTRLDALTGIRFLAAMSIVVFHFDNLGITLQANWYLGVDFFFVLSGFIMVYVYPELDTVREKAQFFLARFARIWPLHALVLLLYVGVLGRIVDHFFLPNMLLLQSYLPIEASYWSYNYPAWSICVEMTFYALFPFIVHRWSSTFWWKTILSIVVPVGIAVVATWAKVPSFDEEFTHDVNLGGLLYTFPPARLAEFLVGMSCCLLYRRARPTLANWPAAYLTGLELVAASTVAACFLRYTNALVPHVLSLPLRIWTEQFIEAAPSAFLILTFAIGGGALSRIFATRPLVYLGDISFTIYMTHALIFDYTKTLFPIAPYGGREAGLIGIAVTIALSAALHRFFEAPARRLINRLPMLLKERDASASSASDEVLGMAASPRETDVPHAGGRNPVVPSS